MAKKRGKSVAKPKLMLKISMTKKQSGGRKKTAPKKSIKSVTKSKSNAAKPVDRSKMTTSKLRTGRFGKSRMSVSKSRFRSQSGIGESKYGASKMLGRSATRSKLLAKKKSVWASKFASAAARANEHGPDGVIEEAEDGRESAEIDSGAEDMEAPGPSQVSDAKSQNPDEVSMESAESQSGITVAPGRIMYAPIEFGLEPIECVCPTCEEVITTETKFVRGVSCLCPFSWIPCCYDGCQDVEHSCPKCQRVLGRYRRCQKFN